MKEWYVKGCGEEIQDIDAIIAYLRPYIIGYEVIVVGNSAGGYLAVILGNALDAKYVIDISGQVDIWQYAEDEKQYPELNAARNNPRASKYYNIQELLNNTQIPIFYFYASRCWQDIEQWQLIQNGNSVFPFAFFSKSHGATIFPFNWPYILNCSIDELFVLYDIYKGKIIFPSLFAFKTLEFAFFIRHWPKYITNYWGKKVVGKMKLILGIKSKG